MKLSRKSPLWWASAIAIIIPEILLCAVMIMQDKLGLKPCEMCMQQRYALYVALALGAAAALIKNVKVKMFLLAGSAGAFATSASVAIRQLGAERGWWKLYEPCAADIVKGRSVLDSILNTTFIPCDVPQWKHFGLTLADLNAATCLITASFVIFLIGKAEKATRHTTPAMPPKK